MILSLVLPELLRLAEIMAGLALHQGFFLARSFSVIAFMREVL